MSASTSVLPFQPAPMSTALLARCPSWPTTPAGPTPCTPSSCGSGSPGARAMGSTRWSGSSGAHVELYHPPPRRLGPDGLLGDHDAARHPGVLPVRTHRWSDPAAHAPPGRRHPDRSPRLARRTRQPGRATGQVQPLHPRGHFACGSDLADSKESPVTTHPWRPRRVGEMSTWWQRTGSNGARDSPSVRQNEPCPRRSGTRAAAMSTSPTR